MFLGMRQKKAEKIRFSSQPFEYQRTSQLLPMTLILCCASAFTLNTTFSFSSPFFLSSYRNLMEKILIKIFPKEILFCLVSVKVKGGFVMIIFHPRHLNRGRKDL